MQRIPGFVGQPLIELPDQRHGPFDRRHIGPGSPGPQFSAGVSCCDPKNAAYNTNGPTKQHPSLAHDEVTPGDASIGEPTRRLVSRGRLQRSTSRATRSCAVFIEADAANARETHRKTNAGSVPRIKAAHHSQKTRKHFLGAARSPVSAPCNSQAANSPTKVNRTPVEAASPIQQGLSAVKKHD
jgi:hypothetical protein